MKILGLIVISLLLASVVSISFTYALTDSDEKSKKKTEKSKKKSQTKKKSPTASKSTLKPKLEKQLPIKQQSEKPKLKTPEIPQTPVLDLTGRWGGTAIWSASFDYWDPDLGSYREVCQFTGNIMFDLVQNGNVVSGSAQASNIQLVNAKKFEACSNYAGMSPSGVVNANIFGSGFSGTVGVLNIAGSFTSDLINGKIIGSLGGVVEIGGEFTGHRV